MSDLQLLLKDAAAPAEQRTLDVERAMRRGDQLRRRRQATRVGGVALAVVAVPLLLLQLPTTGGHNVEWVPDQRPVFSTPTPNPTPTPTPSQEPEDRVVGVVIPAPLPGGDEDAASPRLRPHRTSEGQDDTATGAAAARRPGGRRGAPAPTISRPATDDDAQPPEEEEGEPHTGPPHRESCVLYGSQLQMGETDTCTFTATDVGGYEAYGMAVPPVYDEDVATPPDYWTLEIRRGDEVTRYDVKNAPGPCMADVISPGDVVTATVYRSDPTKDGGQAGYVDLYVGKGYGPGCEEN